MTAPAGPAVRVCLLGELSVECGGTVRRGSEIGSRKGRAVLAMLAASPAHTVSADALAEVLWPTGAPDRPAATIASLVSRLRRTLGAQVVTGGSGGYRIGQPPDVEAATRRVASDAGFTRFRRAAETPFNLVYEARP